MRMEASYRLQGSLAFEKIVPSRCSLMFPITQSCYWKKMNKLGRSNVVASVCDPAFYINHAYLIDSPARAITFIRAAMRWLKLT